MSAVAAIRPHLERRFDDRRIVFWHDPEGQYTDDLDSLDLPGVQTIRVANDEYGVKHRVLHQERDAKFLIYRTGPIPSDIGNWLFDLELAYGVFTANRTALVSDELGLAEDVSDVLRDHEKFFNAAKRIQSLKALLNPDDDATDLCAKMTAVLLGQKEHSFTEVTRTLLIENSKGQHTKYDTLVENGLADFFWRGAASIYCYESPSPSIDDLVLWIFRKAVDGFVSDRPGGLRQIQLDFANLRNDRRSQDALATLAKRAARDLDYASTIEGADLQQLKSVDIFPETDQKIISELVRAVAEQTIAARDVTEIVRARQSTVWIESYKQFYAAIASASELMKELSVIDFAMSSFDDGLQRYCREWFRIDQLYRQFTFAYRTCEGSHVLEPLREQVEKRYVNKFVYELGNAWQQQVDEVDTWRSSLLSSQTSFYKEYVDRLLRDNKKIVVIISDALRYEIAEELRSRIRQEDRFDAPAPDAVLGVLPSYTKLGMAALLPHRTLTYSVDASAVLADGQPTHDTASRGKILATVGGSAIQAENFKALTTDERRELYKNNRVLYIYHNRIDATGEKEGTERQVFEAVDDTLADIVQLVKMSANANATNIVITADHGFLFQTDPLADSFFLSTPPHGDDLNVVNKRFVLGRGLKVDIAFNRFRSEQLGLDSDLEIQVPKSIHRLRRPGSGSRFVHGGATLQEIVVPVLTVNKKRKSDTKPVDVQIWPETDKITTGQVVVRLYQSEPVSDKVQPRTLRAGLYVGETLISNQEELIFDQTSTDKRDRYQNSRMLLSPDANDYNNRQVEFRLDERIPNTRQWRPYRTAMYTLKRSFASDFDF